MVLRFKHSVLSFSIATQPNSMGIDPSDDHCVPFYHKMRELKMVRDNTALLRYLCNALHGHTLIVQYIRHLDALTGLHLETLHGGDKS